MKKTLIASVLILSSLAACAASPEQALEVFEAVAAAADLPLTPHLVTGGTASSNASSQVVGRFAKPCIVSTSTLFLEKWDAHALASIFGHELAHCVLKHKDASYVGITESTAWTQEYEADSYGAQLANKAGFEAYQGFTQVLGGSQASASHPSGEARLAALCGQPRQLRQLVAAQGSSAELTLVEHEDHLSIRPSTR